jgi:putative membrane protein
MNETIAHGKPKTANGIDVAERTYMRTTFIGLSVVSILATVACGGTDQPAKTPDNAATPTSATASGSDSSPTLPAPASSAAPSDAAPVAATTADTTPAAQPLLSDDQILQVVHTANQGEIAQAKLAKGKAQDARVKKLAAMMIKDHTAADHKAMALAKKLNGPTPSATSTSLESDAQNNTTTLESESGADFDKGYVDTQVKEHQAVLDLIDQQLLPNAKDANVKTFVTGVRAKVAMHLQHARELQAAMAK